MKFGYGCVKPMREQLLAFIHGHGFESLADFQGKSVEYFTSLADLVHRQAERKQSRKIESSGAAKPRSDSEWTGDEFVRQSDGLAQ